MEINAMEGSKALLREIEVLKMDVTDRKTTGSSRRRSGRRP